MSLSFPTAPTVGQMFNGLMWDGVKWASPQGPAGLANIVLEVQLNANQAVTAGSAWNTVKYDTKITDLQNAYVPSTGLFTPRQAGLYAVSACYAIASQTGVLIAISVCKNGSIANAQSQNQRMVPQGVFGNLTVSASALIWCNGTTDTISAQGYAGGTAANFQSAGNANNAINMVATLLQVGPQGPAGTTGPGNKVLLNSTVVTTPVASIDFLNPAWFDGTYDELELHCLGALPATTDTTSQIRSSSDGATWNAGASDYSYMWQHVAYNNTTGTGGAVAAIANLGPATSNAVGFDYYCIIRIHVVQGTTNRSNVMWHGTWQSSGATFNITGGCTFNNAPFKGIGFRFGAINTIRGTFNLFGIKK